MNKALEEMVNLKYGWDGFNAPSPNRDAISAASEFIDSLSNMVRPNAILPSAHGGVGISFSNNDRYASIEFCNDGEIVMLKMVGESEPDASLIHCDEARKEVLRHLS